MPALEKISNSKWVQQLFPSCIWNLNRSGEKTIYLSFDDGPMEGITPWVLDTLAEYNAKATFFCVGSNVEKYLDIFDLIRKGGHAVGNHTQNHINGWKTLYGPYLNDVAQCNEIVHSNLFRPPYGKLKPLQLRALKKDYKIIMWSFLTGDYLHTLSPEKVLEDMKTKITGGDIIVFHDSIKAEKNLKYLLPRVLEHFSAEGFIFNAINL